MENNLQIVFNNTEVFNLDLSESSYWREDAVKDTDCNCINLSVTTMPDVNLQKSFICKSTIDGSNWNELVNIKSFLENNVNVVEKVEIKKEQISLVLFSNPRVSLSYSFTGDNFVVTLHVVNG